MLKFGFNSGLPSISAAHIYTGAMLPATETYRLKDRGNTKDHLPVNSGAAIQFNGADQYLLTSGLPDQGTWTFAFWYKHLAASDAILAGVIDTETNSRAYIGINLAGKLGVGVNGNTYNDAGYFVEGLEVGTWYPVVFSKNVDDWSLHVDGQKLTGTEPGWTTPQGPIAIGAIYRSSDGTVTNQIAAAMSNIMFANGTSFSDEQAAFYASYPERTFAHFNASDDHAESVFSGLTCGLLLNHGTYGEAMDYSFAPTGGLTTFSTTNATVNITFSAPAGEGLYINGTYHEGQGDIDVSATESAADGIVDIEESYDGALTKITATSQGLSGTAPYLSSNTQLTHADFRYNNLSGSVPDLSSNTKLERLYLGHNNLSGSIPDLSSNTQLTHADFSYNNLSGSVPDLSSNTKLERLYLGHNNLSGHMPDLSSNTKLERLYLSDNNLSGSAPDLSSNQQLTYVNLYFNNFSGPVPDLSSNQQLTYVNFGDNNLSGSAPDLSSNPQLTYVNFGGNNLSGSAPDLSSNPQLAIVYLYFNNFSGPAPDLSSNQQLTYVNFGGSNLSGPAPDLSSNQQLTYVNLYFNNFSGPVPDLSSNQQLTYANFSKNNFTDFAGGTITVSDLFDAHDNALTISAVDSMLQALVDGGTTGPADVVLSGGTNEAPSSVGEAHIDTLRSRGCTVTVTGGY